MWTIGKTNIWRTNKSGGRRSVASWCEVGCCSISRGCSDGSKCNPRGEGGGGGEGGQEAEGGEGGQRLTAAHPAAGLPCSNLTVAA